MINIANSAIVGITSNAADVFTAIDSTSRKPYVLYSGLSYLAKQADVISIWQVYSEILYFIV